MSNETVLEHAAATASAPHRLTVATDAATSSVETEAVPAFGSSNVPGPSREAGWHGAFDYPVCLRLGGRRVLLVGGGEVAGQRLQALVDAGAVVVVVAPELSAGVATILLSHPVRWEAREFVAGDLDDVAIVFVATDDKDVSIQVAQLARARGLWINTADIPELCDFTLPAVGRRGPVVVAVSTTGTAPAVARRLRDELTGHVGHRHLGLIRVVQTLRRRLPAGPSRMKFIRGVIDGDVGSALLRGDRRGAFRRLREALHTHESAAS